MSFQDYFSRQSGVYLRGRPTYPEELFQFLAKMAPSNECCWDCATGNGQAAISLAGYFKKVIATDASQKQIEHAMLIENIEYRVATAENSGLPGHSVDLTTVATGAHWFELDKFYAEVERVSKRNAILAVWAYSEATINAEIDELMLWFMYTFLEAHWPDGRWYVRNSYETLPFPFRQIEMPQFFCKMDWTREHWLDYVRSWSAYNNYVAKLNADPLEVLLPKLDKLWAGTQTKHISWKLNIKCTRF